MLSIEDLESACNASQRIETPRHVVEPPELPFHATFYPYGFPRCDNDQLGRRAQAIRGALGKVHQAARYRANPGGGASGGEQCDRVSSAADVPVHAAASDVCRRCGQLQRGRFGILPDADRDFARRAAPSALCPVFPPGIGRLLRCDPVYNAGACRVCCAGWTRSIVLR